MKLEAEDNVERLEPTLDVEAASRMEPQSVLSCVVPSAAAPPKNYWQAHNFASRLHNEFIALQERGDLPKMRQRFYVLARYYGRTLGILRSSLRSGNVSLINAALRNLMVLHQPLYMMREVAPVTVPLVLTLNMETRKRFLDDLIIRVIGESTTPLTLDAIIQEVHDLHIIFKTERETVGDQIESLISRGYIERSGERYGRAKRSYDSVNLDHAGLEALLGDRLYRVFEENGFRGLMDLVNRRNSFKTFFSRFSGCDPETAELFIAVAVEVTRPVSRVRRYSPWVHADLIGSIFPRPYQRDAFSIFRGYGYKGVLIEAPTGSGKTMMGMMCIQDWLNSLTRGETILILVPTANYVQQWVAELCYKPIGLQISPDEIFTGTPTSLEAEQQRSETTPAILIMTYTALAQIGSPRGKGGFDSVSIEKFLQGSNVQYVILDEVHKVADDLNSVSASVAKLLTEWLRDGSLRGLIGFSGTAEVYRDRFPKLGLQLVYVMPPADLIAYGFVAPFAEFGVPFSYSDREKRVIDLLEEYKTQIRAFIDLTGSEHMRGIFRGIPIERRVEIGRAYLGMYDGQRDQEAAMRKRFTEWEKGKEISLNDINILIIVQLAETLSDWELLESSLKGKSRDEKEAGRQTFTEILLELNRIRGELRSRVYFSDMTLRLDADGFGHTIETQGIQPKAGLSRMALRERARNALSTTIVGLYSSLKNFYFRIGEGRLDTINAIIEAEYSVRQVTGVIVFDNAKHLKWQDQVAVPGYAGVAGVFTQMLGNPRFTPIAALSSEIYMPFSEENPLPRGISDHIRREIMLTELGNTMFGVITQGIYITDEARSELYTFFTKSLEGYVYGVKNVKAPRLREFNRRVLKRFRETIIGKRLGRAEARLLNRVSLDYNIVRKLIGTFFDYTMIARYFDEAYPAELRQADGTLQRFYVVKMAKGEKKLLMYNLMARIFDAEELPINIIIVSSWARTGWNVIKPNVLVDATATRDVTAWQQLRGRAMRARKTWDKRAYELMTQLLGAHIKGLQESTIELPPDVIDLVEKVSERGYINVLDEPSRQLLEESYLKSLSSVPREDEEDDLVKKIRAGLLSGFSQEERKRLAAELMLHRNKVTHIYELVKAYGSTRQVAYDRPTRSWVRTEAISVKHQYEYSVNPFTGRYMSGEAHAPLLYSHDPRENLPSELSALLTERLKGRDHPIVRGWIDAVLSDVAEGVKFE